MVPALVEVEQELFNHVIPHGAQWVQEGSTEKIVFAAVTVVVDVVGGFFQVLVEPGGCGEAGDEGHPAYAFFG